MKIKQPGESPLSFVYDFTDMLGTATIAAASAATIVARGVGALMTRTAQGTVGKTVVVQWSGGVDGETYLTTVQITDSNGDKHELEGEIHCQDLTYVVPVGVGTAYLTADQYVDIFGQTETIRITDETKAGVIDKAKITAAITSASEFTDAFLGGRYTLPLVDVPPILTGIVADLTRERLHKTRPTAQVTAAADAAREQLKLISKGVMTLNVATGDVAPTANASALPMTSGDGFPSVFTPGVMDGYANGFAPVDTLA